MISVFYEVCRCRDEIFGKWSNCCLPLSPRVMEFTIVVPFTLKIHHTAFEKSWLCSFH